MSRAMRQTAEEIREHLNNFRRDPFQNELAKLLNNSPTPSAIQKFANKSPDRYWQSITQAARLAGFNEKIEVDVKFKPLSSLADSELRNLLQGLSKQLNRIEDNTKYIDVSPKDHSCDVNIAVKSVEPGLIKPIDQTETIAMSQENNEDDSVEIVTSD